MSKPFDMRLFLSGVLNGSKTTQQRHLRQARRMQAAIRLRWHRDTPWAWQLKHVHWFSTYYLKNHANLTQYRYRLTIILICRRMRKNWCI